ncbi:very-long-chain (3R)-3-hydroxyacyl-CoA dehydratase hpo-8 [Coccinella septempunctata]|uniref:very-long-chain (3R)-3-hydroxyacyl-CoA dehydratase hpo-8 n=1 Tax=Coccinella septempunctata TaxID=41139 RepID=UPI001D074221|nr:very-long-chain (3R)-3-hydroxyacyl-CoA dehydratase hpo-8 [Coccinella septempunctata]
MASVKENKKKEASALIHNYLIAYNAIQTIGWSFLLYQLITYYLSQNDAKSDKSLYDTVKYTLIIFQNAAILEVIHAFLKFVSSNPIVTVQQISSRVIVVCGVLMVTESSRESLGLPLALFAWSVTEVIRYGNYTFTLLGYVPYFIKWLRYTTFIILYPIGVTGELLCLYAAQWEIRKTGFLSVQMPNTLNFIFNYSHFLILVMTMYIPFFPQLYLHMFTLRRKVLGGQTPVKKLS